MADVSPGRAADDGRDAVSIRLAEATGDVGQVLATLDRITDGDPQSWFDAWTATAADLVRVW